MGKGRPRAVEKGVLGQSSTSSSLNGGFNIPSGPVYHPTEDEFKNPIEFIQKIRAEAEPYGICKIVPPESWKPPFALDLNSFTFPTKTQALHQLQARSAPCDPTTFELEYDRFLERHGGKRLKRKIIFEGEELDLCMLFNAVKRYGGYDKVVKEKKWGKVASFVCSGKKASECGKYVLSQLYLEHLYDYEKYYTGLSKEKHNVPKGDILDEKISDYIYEKSSHKRRRKNLKGERIEVCKTEKQDLDQTCQQCRSGLHGEVMLLCDRCNKGWHIYCLSPPLKRIPPGNWYCLECTSSDKDIFGFVPGKQYSLESFRRLADRARRKWVGPTPSTRVQLERKFWEIVEGSVGEVEVMYGSDLDTSVFGSGFPRLNDKKSPSVEVEGEVWDKYSTSPWNLNNLPKVQGSMLRTLHNNIAGVMVPWLYIGMLFSSFCWHFEDHCLYSMNYLHWGEPKYWYSVPGCKASDFEKVMRNSLPDLFDAQPDLLFQLVTMLNPTVLQQNKVPVYSVLQESGSFVITFPRSYHGGFNFGLNCAEAVNFAPADWLSHGGFGSELYRLYRKAAVFSHEELLYAVAKSSLDTNTSIYLNKELGRIYDKEETWRHSLWRNGILSSSPMSPRKQPLSVGMEEDPACIICHQYLYLSAVSCPCRPSEFVCLEHWEHLCECSPSRHQLLYRHTLEELNNLVVITDQNDPKLVKDEDCKKHVLCDLSKKVKGAHVTFAQLAEEWCLNSSKILQIPYCRGTYVNALKEAEQFLWAGSEMNLVRQMVEKLVAAQSWADGIKHALSKVGKWTINHSQDKDKVQFDHVNNLLSFDPVPCNQPAYLKLKHYEQEARALTQEIEALLSTCPNTSLADLERLYSKVCDLPILLKESEKLLDRLSSTKMWVDNVRNCISEKCPAAVEVDTLYKLQLEMSDIGVQDPESSLLLNLIKQVDTCRAQCRELLNGSITHKKLQPFLKELDGFSVNIPELELLRKKHNSAVSLISRFKVVLDNIQEREDQEHIVDELDNIQRERALLDVEVDELSCVEIELKKACWRVKALKVIRSKMPLEIIQQLMMEATTLEIEKEQLFGKISEVLATAKCWEERAKHILGSKAQISEFEDALRISEDISATLPSLDNIKDALSMANSWLLKSKTFLSSDIPAVPSSASLLKIECLKDLISESQYLKISLKEPSKLQEILNNCVQWEQNASLLLHDAISLLDIKCISDGTAVSLGSVIEKHVCAVESSINVGTSLGFDLSGVTRLQEACSVLCWCSKTLSFCSISPKLEEVEMLLAAAETLPITHVSSSLFNSLFEGLKWIKKSIEISFVCNSRKFMISDAEEAIEESQKLNVSFPLMVAQLVNAISKHISWEKQVKSFFSLKPVDRTWKALFELKQLGISYAFNCPELDMIFLEVHKIELWKQQCWDIAGDPAGDSSLLVAALAKIIVSLDISLCIYDMSNSPKARNSCTACSNNIENKAFLSCSICKHCYHLECLGRIDDVKNSETSFICTHCPLIMSGKVWAVVNKHLKLPGTRPDFNKLFLLLSEAKDLLCIEERNLLQDLVEKALACRAYLSEVVGFAIAYLDKDPEVAAEKLATAIKALEVAGVYDEQSNSKLEQALAINSWRIRANKLLVASRKPQIEDINRHFNEGLEISILPEDSMWRRLTEAKNISLQWADKAKKVSMDSGELELDKVFDLISEGENIPVHMEKELKLLRERSMLYCICRKPYDKKPMIACDKCNEWYHFYCIKLIFVPKLYICPACKPSSTEQDLVLFPTKTAIRSRNEPQTPTPQSMELRRKPRSSKLLRSNNNCMRGQFGEIRDLLWKNKKPSRRMTRKRLDLSSLSPLNVDN
ncbi:lysine-specific demethylase 5B [Impatiens glandulifera]|uniref:lysine-specific demethylase 5B n=1 Tax=Impatiens glandulifera TaxID=253017 RepID=UPI001FB0D56A|nr:lysine-specific demethylase 5B [Impatiens glandulifera]